MSFTKLRATLTHNKLTKFYYKMTRTPEEGTYFLIHLNKYHYNTMAVATMVGLLAFYV